MTALVDTYLCGINRASEPIKAAVTKLGGVPVFLGEANWPTCEHCGTEMDFLAQISLESPTCFSTRFEMAYVFMCPGKLDERGWLECRTWDPHAGANAVILQESSGSLTAPRRCPRTLTTLLLCTMPENRWLTQATARSTRTCWRPSQNQPRSAVSPCGFRAEKCQHVLRVGAR